MTNITPERLTDIFTKIKDTKIIVIGDLMLDRYIWGTVGRISPEAPVPVVEVQSESSRLGGAANVAHNITTLGATAIPIGIVGDDQFGAVVRDFMGQITSTSEGIITDSSRITTVKSRVIAHGQHVVRTDRESKTPISAKICDRIIEFLETVIDEAHAIIFEDYNKGLITSRLIKKVLALAADKKKPVMVDPKFNHFFDYQGVAVIKPNRREAEEVLGLRMDSEEAVMKVGGKLLERLNCENVLLTLGEDGMYLFQKSGEVTHVETKARKVHDVSGAGDTVIGTFAVVIAAGANPQEAATLANYAAGLVCEEVGIVPIYHKKLQEVILEDNE